MFANRQQMCHLQLLAIVASVANSTGYFVHCVNFGYGSKLVQNGEMQFDHVFRLSIYILCVFIFTSSLLQSLYCDQFCYDGCWSFHQSGA